MPKTIAVPQNAEELREILTDKASLKELLSDPEGFADFTEAAVNARLKNDPGLNAQIKEQHEKFMLDWLRDHQNAGVTPPWVENRLNLGDPTTRARIRPRTIYNKDAVGAVHDKSFDDLAGYFHGISEHSFKNGDLSRKLDSLKNDLSSIKPSDGGFLIPEILRAELLRVALEKAVVRSRARVIPMDSQTVPFPTVDSTSNVSSVYGGVVGYWTEEGATLTESQPKFGRIELKANKLVLYTEVPNELIRDARPSLEAFLGDIFPEAIAWFEDVAFFIGGGVGEPLGFLNAAATVSIDRAGSSTDTIVWADIVNIYARMLPQSLDRAVWVISPDVLPQLLTMTVGSGNAAVWIGGGNFPSGASNPPMSLLGCPIVVSEKAKTLGTPGDVTLVDFGFYLVGDRQAMSARQSEDYRFQNDVTAFRVIERLDGRPWLQSAITPQNGGPALSPFVTAAN